MAQGNRTACASLGERHLRHLVALREGRAPTTATAGSSDAQARETRAATKCVNENEDLSDPKKNVSIVRHVDGPLTVKS